MPSGAPSTRRSCEAVFGELVVASLAGAVGIAERQRRDLAGGPQIARQQRRREALRVGDVVEAVADGVGRQERDDVDVDVEQILDRARVLGAIEPLERPPAGSGLGGRGRVETCLERTRPAPSTLRAPAASRPAAASSPTVACAPSSPRRRVLNGAVVDVESGQRQPAGAAPLAVTNGAVLFDRGGLCLGRRSRRWRAGRGSQRANI